MIKHQQVATWPVQVLGLKTLASLNEFPAWVTLVTFLRN